MMQDWYLVFFVFISAMFIWRSRSSLHLILYWHPTWKELINRPAIWCPLQKRHHRHHICTGVAKREGPRFGEVLSCACLQFLPRLCLQNCHNLGSTFLATPVSHAINMKVTRIWNNDPNTALCITNLHGECDILLTFTPSLRDKPYSWINNNS